MAYLTVKQVSEMTGMGKSSVYIAFNAGQLRGYRYGLRKGGIKVEAISVQEYIRSRTNVLAMAS